MDNGKKETELSSLTAGPASTSSADAFAGAFKSSGASSSKPAAGERDRGGWSSALTRMAKSKDPKKDLSRDELLIHDKWTLAIFDAYPKAKFHFLVLPRIPFALPQEGEDGYELLHPKKEEPKAHKESQDGERESKKPRLGLEGGKLTFGTTSGGTVPSSHLADINALLKSPYAAYVLSKMRLMGEKVIDIIKSEMPPASLDSTPCTAKESPSAGAECCGAVWPINMGFHAVPSMPTVHMHVISQDLVSPRLKNAKHYNSFHPTHGFWLSVESVAQLIAAGTRSLPKKAQEYEKLLRPPLRSLWNGQIYPNVPALKSHLEKSWKEDIFRRRKDTQTQQS